MGSKEEHETLDKTLGLLQEFPMERTSCHVKSPWVAYYVYPLSSTYIELNGKTLCCLFIYPTLDCCNQVIER
jgi:hypothetical protein